MTMKAKARWAAVRTGASAPVQHIKPDEPGMEDAGYDLSVFGDWTLLPGVLTYLPTGIAVAPEPGWWYQIVHRSSTPRRGLQVEFGTIDNGFRGELLAAVRNMQPEPVDIAHGERLVQIVFYPLVVVEWEQVDTLPGSVRGENGFGSTGLK